MKNLHWWKQENEMQFSVALMFCRGLGSKKYVVFACKSVIWENKKLKMKKLILAPNVTIVLGRSGVLPYLYAETSFEKTEGWNKDIDFGAQRPTLQYF